MVLAIHAKNPVAWVLVADFLFVPLTGRLFQVVLVAVIAKVKRYVFFDLHGWMYVKRLLWFKLKRLEYIKEPIRSLFSRPQVLEKGRLQLR